MFDLKASCVGIFFYGKDFSVSGLNLAYLEERGIDNHYIEDALTKAWSNRKDAQIVTWQFEN